MSSKRKFVWTEVEQDGFDRIKRTVARDSLITYPVFNETFKVHTNVRAFQLEAFIAQKVKHIAFDSMKLIDSNNGKQ